VLQMPAYLANGSGDILFLNVRVKGVAMDAHLGMADFIA